MFTDDPVERKELVAKIKYVREELNLEDEVERRISHMYLNNANHPDPSEYF
jgi:hypothetical protein